MSEEIEEQNARVVWQKLKSDFESNDAENVYFYKDYLTNENGFKEFFSNLKKYEDWLDLSKEVSEDDYEELRKIINGAVFDSQLITMKVGNLTDKYFRDGCH